MNDPIKTRTRRAFIGWGATLVGAAGVWRWAQKWSGLDLEVAKPLRKVLEANGAIWNRIRPGRVEAPNPPPDGAPARVNGDIGLSAAPGGWIDVLVEHDDRELATSITRAVWESLPRANESALFCCIEGWSESVTYGGVRFRDALERLGFGRKADGSLFNYVGLETPDEEYYVSIDMESMLHEQTLLADVMNGRPLTAEHGSPLRLIIPIKYGIKSLKRVAAIRFSDERPPDYWNERGYDWHASL